MVTTSRRVPLALTPQEASELLGCSAWTVRRLIREGYLRAVRIGRIYRIRVDDLAALLTPEASNAGSETAGL
jgi:excisionase family DNA binding protein